MQHNLFVVMRLGSSIVLSHLNASFEPQYGVKDLLSARFLVLAAAAAAASC